jgi:hypothetical protein
MYSTNPCGTEVEPIDDRTAKATTATGVILSADKNRGLQVSIRHHVGLSDKTPEPTKGTGLDPGVNYSRIEPRPLFPPLRKRPSLAR